MLRVIVRWMSVAVVVIAMAACGGGGGGGGGGPTQQYPLSISVPSVNATFAQIVLPSAVQVIANVQGTVSTSVVYVTVVDSAATFTGTPGISQITPTQYAASLLVADTLAIGTYTGTLTISVCGDPQCAGVLGRTTTSYTVTITDNPVVTGTWDRNNVTLLAVQGESELSWPIGLRTPAAGNILYARFSDATNIVRLVGASQTIRTSPSVTENLAVTVSASTPPGTHTGSLDVVFCRDINCTRAYRGLTRLSYVAKVMPATDLKPLAPLTGAPDWTMMQGNAARTGYVPVTLNAANFSQRWKWVSTDQYLDEYLDPVAADGKVFVIAAPSPTFAVTPILRAIDEASGSVVWARPLPDSSVSHGGGLGPLTPPAIAGSNVFVARTTHTYPGEQGLPMAFRIADGTPTFTPISYSEAPGEFGEFFADFSYSGSTFFRPGYLTPIAGAVLFSTRGVGGLGFASLDQSSGSTSAMWPSCTQLRGSGIFVGGAIAINASQSAFVATNDGLVLADTCQAITSSLPIGFGTGPVAVPGTSDVAAVGFGNLVAFDTTALQVKWSATAPAGVFVGTPAVAGSTLYVLNNGRRQLEARRMSDGQVQWSWQPSWPDDSSFIGNIIATQNLVFVSTRNRVYAIDIATRQALWTYPYGGRLALSANGILYISRGALLVGREGLVAINLR